MKGKLFASLLVLGTASLMSVSAFASINSPADHKLGNTYEECAVKCNEFVDAKACLEFRQAHLLCTRKKTSTRPIFTAQQLESMEC